MEGRGLSKELIDWIQLDFQNRRETLELISIEKEQREAPHLSILQVGDRRDSNLFIRNKKRLCDQLGFSHAHLKLSDDIDAGRAIYV